MSDSIDNALNKLQDMLSTDDGKKNLEDMVSSFGGNSGGGFSSGFDPTLLVNIKTVIDRVQNGTDPRSNLLNALKPYLSRNRISQVDNAIKIMSLGRIPDVIKSMKNQTR